MVCFNKRSHLGSQQGVWSLECCIECDRNGETAVGEGGRGIEQGRKEGREGGEKGGGRYVAKKKEHSRSCTECTCTFGFNEDYLPSTLYTHVLYIHV